MPQKAKDTLGAQIYRKLITEVLAESENSKTTGINGIPYKFRKKLTENFKIPNKTDSDSEKPAFDIINVLTEVYKDIENHSIIPEAKFVASWMCPLYKKKDK